MTTDDSCAHHGTGRVREPLSASIGWSRRRLNLSAIPKSGRPVIHVDMDMTNGCNLRCPYCYKEKRTQNMKDAVAIDAVIWLIRASGKVRKLRVALMGGEPLLRFDLIKKVVPFAKRRAAAAGKDIHFGVTTNCTLVTDEVLDFWKKWKLSFHTSIDGIPKVQDRNRPRADGGPSSPMVERAVPKILAYQPWTTARCTVIPETVKYTLENYQYFRALGYKHMALITANPPSWDEESMCVFEEQFRQVADAFIVDTRAGVRVRVKGIDEGIRARIRELKADGHSPHRMERACGAARGMVLIDVDGGIWPCHRFDRSDNQPWRLGSIYEGFDESVRDRLLTARPFEGEIAQCATCEGNVLCAGGCVAENIVSCDTPYVRHRFGCKVAKIWLSVGAYVHDILHAERNPLFMKDYYQEKSDDPESRRSEAAVDGEGTRT